MQNVDYHKTAVRSFVGRNAAVTPKWTVPIRSNTKQFYFNSNCYLYMCGTCFDLYWDHPQEDNMLRMAKVQVETCSIIKLIDWSNYIILYYITLYFITVFARVICALFLHFGRWKIAVRKICGFFLWRSWSGFYSSIIDNTVRFVYIFIVIL